ncbi:DUF402 domain-containing protein [Actinoplanes sp. NPDC049265]|uniref:DUF402 domain-containing protein n=1 Tax=Actinoplanes sp. NPDC049265 TaxID=3363902 RepID=UPI00371F80A6
MRFTKWGGRLHWHYAIEPLGTDAFGAWYGTRAGTTIQRGDEAPHIQKHDFLTLIPAEGWYVAAFNAEADERTELYIDISTPPTTTGTLIEAVDLDLDVIRTRDGRFILDDEDEFEEHQMLYGYPAHVIAAARAEADRLMAEVTAGAEPFGAVGRAWLARYVPAADGGS